MSTRISLARPLFMILLAAVTTGLSAQVVSSRPAQPTATSVVWPNPFDEVINLHLQNPPCSQVIFQIVNIQGTIVLQQLLSTTGPAAVSTTNIVPGHYTVRVIGRNQVLVQQQVEKFETQ